MKDWITDEMIEPVAIAICYGGFWSHEGDALLYWDGVREEAKTTYRGAARRLLAGIARSGRIMPVEPTERTIRNYMTTMRLSNRANARAHIRAVYEALPSIYQEEVC